MKKTSGFTLVELSIVLVILGLLVGGVLAGQSLIHAAELRAISTELTNYKTAIGAFRDKYLAIPGDMNNAVKFWGAQAGSTADGTDATCMALTTAATSSAVPGLTTAAQYSTSPLPLPIRVSAGMEVTDL